MSADTTPEEQARALADYQAEVRHCQNAIRLVSMEMASAGVPGLSPMQQATLTKMLQDERREAVVEMLLKQAES